MHSSIIKIQNDLLVLYYIFTLYWPIGHSGGLFADGFDKIAYLAIRSKRRMIFHILILTR